MIRPYAEFAQAYFDAGWQPLPLPPGAKWPPPDGYTGHRGKDVEIGEVLLWIERHPTGNIALRLPDGVIGIDVDCYDGKPGSETLAALEAELGPLPQTWLLTSREDGSGIRFFRAPTGLSWRGQAGPAIEVIQRGHRYAVAAPSIHPKTGRPYRWIGPRGEDRVPSIDELPELPAAWVEHLSTGMAGDGGPVADLTEDEVRAWLDRMYPSPMCARVSGALADRLQQLSTGESRHETMTAAVYELVKLGQEGHRGVRDALASVQGAFYRVLGSERDGASEWRRSLIGAVGKASAEEIEPECSCLGHEAEPVERKRSAIQHLRAVLMDRESLRMLPPPTPLIDRILFEDSIAWIYGPPSSAKTFMALDWSCTLAAGRTAWYEFSIPNPGPVLYIAGEGVRGVGLRVEAWEIANRATASGLWVIPEPVQVTKDEYVEALSTIAAEIGARMIVLDTQARMSIGVDENAASEMGVFIDQVEKIRRATKACILVVHHARKDGDTERGSGAIRGAATTMIKMTGRKNEPRCLEVDKQKDTEELSETLMFRLTDVEGSQSAVLVREHNFVDPEDIKPENPRGVAGLEGGLEDL